MTVNVFTACLCLQHALKFGMVALFAIVQVRVSWALAMSAVFLQCLLCSVVSGGHTAVFLNCFHDFSADSLFVVLVLGSCRGVFERAFLFFFFSRF